MNTVRGKRLTILSNDEIAELYDIPSFDADERDDFFFLEPSEMKIVEELSNEAVKIDFVLQLGYFKSKMFFFNFTFQEVRHDVWYVINRHFPKAKFPKKQLGKNYHYANQKSILALHNYRQVSS